VAARTGHGDFVNERRLRDDEIATITTWASHGAPKATRQAPAIPDLPSGWQLGTPDSVLTSAEPYTLRRARRHVPHVRAAGSRRPRALRARHRVPRRQHAGAPPRQRRLDPRRTGRRLDRADAEPGFAAMPEGEVQDVFGWSSG
jgi:hypothetical protein